MQSSRYEGVFDDDFFYFSSKLYVVTPHLNRLIEMVQMRGHNKHIVNPHLNRLVEMVQMRVTT